MAMIRNAIQEKGDAKVGGNYRQIKLLIAVGNVRRAAIAKNRILTS